MSIDGSILKYKMSASGSRLNYWLTFYTANSAFYLVVPTKGASASTYQAYQAGGPVDWSKMTTRNHLRTCLLPFCNNRCETMRTLRHYPTNGAQFFVKTKYHFAFININYPLYYRIRIRIPLIHIFKQLTTLMCVFMLFPVKKIPSLN